MASREGRIACLLSSSLLPPPLQCFLGSHLDPLFSPEMVSIPPRSLELATRWHSRAWMLVVEQRGARDYI